MEPIKVNAGDKLQVKAIYIEPNDCDTPSYCVVFSPILRYMEVCSIEGAVGYIMDEILDGICISESSEYVDKQLKLVGKSLISVRQKMNTAIKTETPTYFNCYSEVLFGEIGVMKDEDFVEGISDGGILDWDWVSQTIIK